MPWDNGFSVSIFDSKHGQSLKIHKGRPRLELEVTLKCQLKLVVIPAVAQKYLADDLQ